MCFYMCWFGFMGGGMLSRVGIVLSVWGVVFSWGWFGAVLGYVGRCLWWCVLLVGLLLYLVL